MKTFSARHLLTGLIAGVVAMSSPAASQMILKFHHDLPADSAQHLGALKFEDLVETRTEGAIDVEIYPNNALGNDVEVAQQMQLGAVHAAPIPTAKLSNFNPALQLIDLPFLFPSPEVTYAFLDGEIGQRLLADLAADGFVATAFWESGFKQFTCNHRVTGPADFEGRKVRVMESPLLIAQFETMGANATPIAFSEVYTALQQGVVECQENPVVSITKMKFFEVQDYMMLSDHGYLGTAFLFSKVWFDMLDPETQEILVEASEEAGTYQREQSALAVEGYLDEIRAAGGTEIVPLTADQKAVFAEAMQPVHDAFAEEIGADLVDDAHAEIERLKAAQ